MAKSISQEEYDDLSPTDKKNYLKEWACVCNECNEKWNYLAEVETKMNSQIFTNACVQTGSCCNPCVGLAASNANTQLNKQVSELKQCPKCKSSNVKRNAKFFKKQ